MASNNRVSREPGAGCGLRSTKLWIDLGYEWLVSFERPDEWRDRNSSVGLSLVRTSQLAPHFAQIQHPDHRRPECAALGKAAHHTMTFCLSTSQHSSERCPSPPCAERRLQTFRIELFHCRRRCGAPTCGWGARGGAALLDPSCRLLSPYTPFSTCLLVTRIHTLQRLATRCSQPPETRTRKVGCHQPNTVCHSKPQPSQRRPAYCAGPQPLAAAAAARTHTLDPRQHRGTACCHVWCVVHEHGNNNQAPTLPSATPSPPPQDADTGRGAGQEHSQTGSRGSGAGRTFPCVAPVADSPGRCNHRGRICAAALACHGARFLSTHSVQLHTG